MINKSYLKDILRENNIKFYSYWDKKRLVKLAKENGLWPEKTPNPEKPRDPRFDRLKGMRCNPRKVCIDVIKTGEIHNFPSIFKASKFLECCPQTVTNWNGRVLDDKYKITMP